MLPLHQGGFLKRKSTPDVMIIESVSERSGLVSTPAIRCVYYQASAQQQQCSVWGVKAEHGHCIHVCELGLSHTVFCCNCILCPVRVVYFVHAGFVVVLTNFVAGNFRLGV